MYLSFEFLCNVFGERLDVAGSTLRVEGNPVEKLMSALLRYRTLCHIIEGNKHVPVFGIPMVALYGFVQERPHLIRASFRSRPICCEESEGRQAHRSGIHNKERRLRCIDARLHLLGMCLGDKRQRIKHFPARLRLGTSQGIEKVVQIRQDRRRILLCDAVDLLCRSLALAA